MSEWRPGDRRVDMASMLRVNQAKIKDDVLEDDGKTDPRFTATAAELEKKGIKDYQLDYALKTLKRLAPAGPAPAKTAAR